ncbi:succinate dehydrogenase, partial [Candidatus Aerophobetes bacterium]|nr:succinate dehydrogenase [Candidatus Aerophobetes bacterium]
ETRNLLTVAKMIMGAARIRRESRGPHLYFHSLNDSEPLPRNDKLWQKYIVVKKTAKNMQFEIEKPVTI